MNRLRRLPLAFFGTAAAVLALDHLTKYWASHLSGLSYGAYPPEGGIELVPGYFSLVYTSNAGAAWGMFAGQRVLLSLLGVAALFCIVYFRRALGLDRTFLRFVFGLISGGIAGNLVDRILFGRVTDFLDFHLRDFYRWPTFNIADSAMVVGVALYIVYALFHREEESGTQKK